MSSKAGSSTFRHRFASTGRRLPGVQRGGLHRPIGIFELLEIDESLRELIRERAPSQSPDRAMRSPAA
jgi:type II secretory ATPase GspE/PulE/Tfp pilus assembly ATPase PilB-like protein